MENTAELVLKFDLNDNVSRDKFEAILNSYNYHKLFVEFKRSLIRTKNTYRATDDCEIIAGLKEALDLFEAISDKYGLVQ